MNQRYFENYRNVDLDGISCENFKSWVERGAIYSHSFRKTKGNMSTVAQIQCNFHDLSDNVEIFVASKYSRLCKVTTKDGFITGVQCIEA